MKATFNGAVIADAPKEDLIFIEGGWYFPADSINEEYFTKTDTPYVCAWKGRCQYYSVDVDGQQSKDGAFTYPSPEESAISRVKKDFSGYYAFWNGIEVSE